MARRTIRGLDWDADDGNHSEDPSCPPCLGQVEYERMLASVDAFVALSLAPGEAYQFDWSHEVVLINGAPVTADVAHIRLCHSRMLVERPYPCETQEMVVDAHDSAFDLFKGARTRRIQNNTSRGLAGDMKTVVDTIMVGRERAYNRRFQHTYGHYQVEPVACSPSSGWEKGQVENQIGPMRERFFTPRLRVKSVEELNAWLLDQFIAYARAHRHPELRERTIWDAFEAERPSLVFYTGRFDGFHPVPASMSKTCLVRSDNNCYLVAAHSVGQGRRAEYLCRMDFVVLDELGYLPFAQSGGQ